MRRWLMLCAFAGLLLAGCYDGPPRETATADDRSSSGGKVQLLWTPAPNWEARAIVSGERARDGDYALNDLGALRSRPFHVARDFEGRTDRDILSTTILTRREGARVAFASTTGVVRWKTRDLTDVDYTPLPLLTRDNAEEATQFTQEVRLQGEAFGGKLDWLVGGIYINEKLTTRDNLKFGSQYGRFAACRILSGGGLAGLYSPTNPSCLVPVVGPATISGATGGGATGADIVAAFTALDNMANVGSTGDEYRQQGKSWALFTHNIVHITDKLDLTLGVRYTNDTKDFGATFANNNTVCTTVQGLVLDDLVSTTTNATAKALAGALIGLFAGGLALSFGLLQFMSHESLQPGGSAFLIVTTAITLPMLGMMLWLHFAPGEARANRFGPVPEGLGFARRVRSCEPAHGTSSAVPA